MKFKKKSQVALEYLVIVAIASILLIPIIILFQNSSRESNNLSNSNLINVMGKRIISESETVFYQGRNSRLRLSFFFPDNLNNITVKSSNDPQGLTIYELAYNSVFDGMRTDMVFFTHVNITFSHNSSDICGDARSYPPSEFLREGYKNIFLESCGRFVTLYMQKNE